MEKMENPSEITEEQPTTTHEYQPRLNEVAQKFLADLDEERQRLSAEFPLCALLIDEGKINSSLHRVYFIGTNPSLQLGTVSTPLVVFPARSSTQTCTGRSR